MARHKALFNIVTLQRRRRRISQIMIAVSATYISSITPWGWISSFKALSNCSNSRGDSLRSRCDLVKKDKLYAADGENWPLPVFRDIFTPYRLQRPPLNFAIYVQAPMGPTLRPARLLERGGCPWSCRASLLQGFNLRLWPPESVIHITLRCIRRSPFRLRPVNRQNWSIP